MDKQKQGQQANTANFLDFQASTKYFFDTAQQCFEHCVGDFQSKTLSA